MTLRQKQSLFIKLVAEFILEIYSLGYELTFGETYRSEFEAKRLKDAGLGVYPSVHTDRLAIDLNLFKDGKFLTSTTDYFKIGQLWKSKHELCRWGGDFVKRKDGNHFSMVHNGRS